jgi:hypothetical protein
MGMNTLYKSTKRLHPWTYTTYMQKLVSIQISWITMATQRIFLITLMLVALIAMPVVARPASRKQEVNAYDVKGAPKALHAEEGKEAAGPSSEKVSTSKYSDAIISEAASKAHMAAAEKDMKEAQVANSPEEAQVAKKAAAKNIVAAMVNTFRGAAAVEPTVGDAMEQKEAGAISAAGAKANDVSDAPTGDVASKYSDAIIYDATSKARIAAAEKNMKEAQFADSPEEAAVAKEAASKNIVAAMVDAFRGAAAVAPTDADATEGKEASTISAEEKDASDSHTKDVASKYSNAIISNAVSKAHIRAAEKDMKEAQVASSPEEASVAKKAAAKNIVAAMVYAAQGVAAVAPSVADATTKDGVGYKA